MFDMLKLDLEDGKKVRLDFGVVEFFLDQVEGGYYDVVGFEAKRFSKLEDALAYLVVEAGVVY